MAPPGGDNGANGAVHGGICFRSNLLTLIHLGKDGAMAPSFPIPTTDLKNQRLAALFLGFADHAFHPKRGQASTSILDLPLVVLRLAASGVHPVSCVAVPGQHGNSFV